MTDPTSKPHEQAHEHATRPRGNDPRPHRGTPTLPASSTCT